MKCANGLAASSPRIEHGSCESVDVGNKGAKGIGGEGGEDELPEASVVVPLVEEEGGGAN